MDRILQKISNRIEVESEDGTKTWYATREEIERVSTLSIDYSKNVIAPYIKNTDLFASCMKREFSTNNKAGEYLLADACNNNLVLLDYFQRLYDVNGINVICTPENNGADALLCNEDYSKVLTKLEFKSRQAPEMILKRKNCRNLKGEKTYSTSSGTYKFHATGKDGNKNAGVNIIERNKDMTLICAMFNPILHERIVGDIFVVEDLTELLTEINGKKTSIDQTMLSISTASLYPDNQYADYVSEAYFSNEILNDYVVEKYLDGEPSRF